MSIIKKAAIFFIFTLEILFFLASFVLNYLTRKKMGMARYVVYMNQKWERNLNPGTLIVYTSIFLLLLLIVLIYVAMKRREELSSLNKFFIAISLLIFIYRGYVLLGSSIKNMRAYYLVALYLSLSCLLSLVKTIMGIVLDGRKNKEAQEDT